MPVTDANAQGGREQMAEPEQQNTIAVSELSHGRWLVTLHGEHDLSTAPALREQLETIIRRPGAVIVDLTPTTFIDSSILGTLLDMERPSQANSNPRLGLILLPESAPDRLLTLVGVRRAFTTYTSLQEAVAQFEATVEPADPRLTARLTARKERIVKNEQAFRDYNNRRMEAEPIEATDDEELIPFVCECGDSDCIEALMITAAEFTEAHSAANRFVVKSGHVYPDVEVVVRESSSHAIVEKHPVLVSDAS
jgi:anti-anti-sigma factor